MNETLNPDPFAVVYTEPEYDPWGGGLQRSITMGQDVWCAKGPAFSLAKPSHLSATRF